MERNGHGVKRDTLGSVPMKFYLWEQKFEFHIQYYFSFDFSLNSKAVQRQVVDQIWPEGCRLLTPGLNEKRIENLV